MNQFVNKTTRRTLDGLHASSLCQILLLFSVCGCDGAFYMSGVVSDDTGNVVPDAVITVEPLDDSFMLTTPFEIRTDAEGAFTIEMGAPAAPAGRHLRLTITKAGFTEVRVVLTLSDDNDNASFTLFRCPADGDNPVVEGAASPSIVGETQ